jgi:hypothetical protein
MKLTEGIKTRKEIGLAGTIDYKDEGYYYQVSDRSKLSVL